MWSAVFSADAPFYSSYTGNPHKAHVFLAVSNMKASSVVLPLCEKDFILKCIRARKRLDGRETYDYRKIKLSFDVERGHCEVQLGQTRVLAQVTCEITKPRLNRQTEGQIFINIELSSMASPAFEAGRMTEYGIELNRLMERFFIESRAVDMESLCIVAGEKVWSVHVDIQVLDHGGNILDCASIAAITALTHFKRPDVSVVGEDVTVHSSQDRDPVPLSILHMPICVTFAFFDNGGLLLVDPSDKEESIMDGRMMMAMNIHREICGAVMGGGVSLETEQIIRCSKIAVVKVEEITQLIKDALEEDEQQRMIGKVGVFESTKNHITTMEMEATEMDLTDALQNASEQSKKACRSLDEQNSNWHSELKVPGPGTAQIGHGGENTWSSLQDEPDRIIIESDEEKEAVSKSPMFETKKLVAQVVSDEDSEEEDVIILTSEKVSTKSPTLATPLVTDPNTVKNPNEKQTAISSATKKNKKRKKKRS